MIQIDTTSPLHDSWLDSDRANTIIHINTRISYWLSKFFLRYIRTSLNVELTPAEIVHGSRFVIASNHQSSIDPFLIGSQIPYATWKHFGTIRYFAANSLFKNTFVRPFLLGLGCFPAQRHEIYPYGLDYGRSQLKMGRALLIFPEGKRTLKGNARIRHGVEVLAKEPNAMIVPAHIEWTRHRWGRTFAYGIGHPFDGSSMTAEEIMERIYAVPVKR
jgi:1-acyl-sn-glycerol-3-phosphate acyltransferase